MTPPRTRLAVSLVLASVLATAAPSAAQPPAADQPAVSLPPGGLGLLESVQIGLQRAPAIRLQQAATEFQEGVALEHGGVFDAAFRSAFSYDYRIQELTETRKAQERERRVQLRDGIAENRQNAENARAIVNLLQQVRQTPATPAGQLAAIARIDPTTATQLQIMETLIRAQPAIAPQLLSLRQEFIDSTVASAQQGLEQGVREFERQERLLQQIGEAPFDEFFRNGLVKFQLAKTFRTGASVAPFFEGGQDGTGYVGKPRSEDFGGKGIFDTFTFRTGADGAMPLLRGRGRIAFGAPEQAARIQVAASQAALQHQAAVTALEVVRAYWALRAAQENAEIAARSLALQTRLRELTEGLIAAADLPQIERARVQASVARAEARLREAERARHEARVQLALVMGLTVTDDPATLPVARDPFPPVPDPAALDPAVLPGRLRQAVELRADVRAAARQQDAGELLARSARTDLRPKLDLQGGIWMTGLEEGIVGHALDRWVGPSASVALAFERPLGNNQFGGRLEQREAEHRRLQVLNADRERQVRLGVVRASQALRDAAARVEQARATVTYYQAVVEAEFERLKAGEVTLIDVILTEDQQASAQLALAAAQRDLATLVAELRYEMGVLVPGDPAALDAGALVTVPRAGDGR